MSSESYFPARTGRTSAFPAPAPDARGTPPPSLRPLAADAEDDLSAVPSLFPGEAPAFRSDLSDAERLFSLGNFSAALRAARRHLESDPESFGARLMVARCTDVLIEFYLERLGGLEQVPVVLIPRDWVAKLRLDSRQAFLLSLFGQGFSYEELIDACPFERVDTLGILARFVEAGIADALDDGGPRNG